MVGVIFYFTEMHFSKTLLWNFEIELFMMEYTVQSSLMIARQLQMALQYLRIKSQYIKNIYTVQMFCFHFHFDIQ